MNAQRGFTLLEIMLVLVIIALCAGIAVIHVQANSTHSIASQTAKRLIAAVELAVDRATLDGHPVGIHFSSEGWQIVTPARDDKNQWRWEPLSEGKQALRQDVWDSRLQAYADTFEPDAKNEPQVVILADGQITPFTLSLGERQSRRPLFVVQCAGSLPVQLSSYGKSAK